jgi:predicted amidohydrolase YtcJ
LKPITAILHNGTVVTMDPRSPRAEAVALSADRIAAVGSNEEILALHSSDTQDMDLGGATLVPGFIESHLHLIAGGRSMLELRLEGCRCPEELSGTIRGATQDTAPGKWIIGHGWEDAAVGDDLPSRLTLDAVAPSHPVYLTRRDGHALWLNSKAIERLAVEQMRPASPDYVPRDESGQPVGVLYENSVTAAARRLHHLLPRKYIERAATVAVNALVQAGITTAHDIVTDYPQDLLLYRAMLKRGKLPVRLLASPRGISVYSSTAFGLLRVFDGPMLQVGPRKFYLDGSFGASTAYLSEAYANDPAGTNVGLRTLTDDQLQAAFDGSLRRRAQIVMHAIGDRAVELAVAAQEGALARYGKRDTRNRLEHVQLVDPNVISRFQQSGLVVSFQPNFLYERDMTVKRVGQERSERCYMIRDFVDAGIPVIFSSDWPYGGGDYPFKHDGSRYKAFEPILGIHASIDRLGFSSAQAITADQALAAYTRTAAWAHHHEKDRGTISPGKLADLVMLSQDITQVPATAILDTDVIMTIVGGEIVYTR